MMKRAWYLCLVGLVLLTACSAGTGTTKAPTDGLVYGGGRLFWITAPEGWVLDTSSGASQGLRAVLYPKGATWKDAAAVMYVNAAQRKPDESLDGFIKSDTDSFKEKGSANIRVEPARPITTKDGKTAQVRVFTGDQFGNSERVAYVQEEQAIVMIVLTARTPADLERSLGAFQSLVASYQFFVEDARPAK